MIQEDHGSTHWANSLVHQEEPKNGLYLITIIETVRMVLQMGQNNLLGFISSQILGHKRAKL